MKTSDFDYQLPERLIAAHPPKKRGDSRLLVLKRQSSEITVDRYRNLDQFLNPGDVLVINNTKVIKARLKAHKLSGDERELVVLENHGQADDWFCHKVLYHGHLKSGDRLYVAEHELEVTQILGNGVAEIKSRISLLELCNRFGLPPLPPYMKRQAEASDIERYQTVFAKQNGSVAAPTASLNMTEDLLNRLRAKSVKIVYLTLHVGLGTFLPIRVDDVTKHKMHQEYFEIPLDSVAEIAQAKQEGRRIVALGTTVTRTLEYAASAILELGWCLADSPESVNQNDLRGEADIFIYPGYQFKIVDALITNFHAPKSTVLMMAAAFAGWDFLKSAYELAIAKELHFLSYGDSMLIT